MDRPAAARCKSRQEMSTDAKIVGYCRACGKALDETSVRSAQGTIFCEEHLPRMTESAQAAPVAAAPESFTASPYTASPYASPYTAKTPPPVPNPDVSP